MSDAAAAVAGGVGASHVAVGRGAVLRRAVVARRVALDPGRVVLRVLYLAVVVGDGRQLAGRRRRERGAVPPLPAFASRSPLRLGRAPARHGEGDRAAGGRGSGGERDPRAPAAAAGSLGLLPLADAAPVRLPDGLQVLYVLAEDTLGKATGVGQLLRENEEHVMIAVHVLRQVREALTAENARSRMRCSGWRPSSDARLMVARSWRSRSSHVWAPEEFRMTRLIDTTAMAI